MGNESCHAANFREPIVRDAENEGPAFSGVPPPFSLLRRPDFPHMFEPKIGENIFSRWRNFVGSYEWVGGISVCLFGLSDRRLIHWKSPAPIPPILFDAFLSYPPPLLWNPKKDL